MITSVEIAEIVVVVFGSLLGNAVVLGVMGFGKNGSRPDEERHSGQVRISSLLFGCLLGTIINLLCMAFVWWLLYITGIIG